MGNVISGKSMAINSDSGSGIFAFRITRKHYPVATVGSNLSGGVDRGLGNVDWTGWFRANGHTPTVFPNDSFTFEGASDNSGDIGVSGTARCLAIEIIADQSNPDKPLPIRHRVWFGANGALSTDQTAPTDSSTPAIYPPKGLCAYFGSSQAKTYYQRLLIFARGINRYVDCSTDGQIQRTTGEIDARFEWKIYSDDSGDWPAPDGGPVSTRMYVTATTYWALNWMQIVDSPDPHEADRDAPRKAVDAAFAAEYDGHNGTDMGTIVNPATTEIWPTDGR